MPKLFQHAVVTSHIEPHTTCPSLSGYILSAFRHGVACTLLGLLTLGGTADVSAQSVPPPPVDPPLQPYNVLAPDQLNQLVAPIALYPDSLVAQVLAASTYPTQVVEANRFVQSRSAWTPDQVGQAVDVQPWDPSVKALTAFPTVLSTMDRNLNWTTRLGNAYYNQPQDVMGSVQTMRRQAYASGKLRTTPQLNVVYSPDGVVIAPVDPALVYVPYYTPQVVWGFQPYYAWYAPPPPPHVTVAAGVAVGFGVGVAVARWSHWGWGWGHWGVGWGPRPVVAFNHVTYVSRSVTVINHGHYGHFDRSPAARDFNDRALRDDRGRVANQRTINSRVQERPSDRGSRDIRQSRPQDNRRDNTRRDRPSDHN